MTQLKLSAIVAVLVLAISSDPVFGQEGPWKRPKPTTAVPTTTVQLTTTIAPTTTVKPTVADLGTTTKKSKPYLRKSKTTTAIPTEAALETSPVATTKLESTTVAKLTTIKQMPTTTIAAETKNVPLITPKPVRRPKPKPSILPKVDFDCRNKDDGYYPDPKDKCSSIYYACVGGLARKMQCGAGDLVYEPESSLCERRQDSFRCTGTRKTTLPTTPAPPQPTPEKVPISCDKLDDGWYPDPQSKCSHIFYSCSNGVGSKFECPGKMYFDPDSLLCLGYEDVVACAGTKPPTKPTTPTTPPTPTEKLPIDCSNLASGQYQDPQKKCSQIYYVCSNGDAVRRTCPQDTYYDDKAKLCDYYDNVFACTGKMPTKPVTASTIAPVPSIASLPSNEYDCTGKPDKSYLPPSKKCSSNYYRCVGGFTYKAKCPKGLFYDIKNDLCDRWMNLYDCSGKYPTKPAPTTPPTPGPTPEKLPIDCAKYVDGDYPDPQKKCSNIYYTCTGGLGVNIGNRRFCPPGTFFDPDVNLCDIRENVRICNGKRPATTKSTPRVPIVTTKSPYDCEKRSDGNYPSDKCASKYWSCVGGSTIPATCPPGTFYDTEKDECGFKENIPDCGGVRPTTQATIVSEKP